MSKLVTVEIFTYDELSDRSKDTARIELNMLFGSNYHKTEEAWLEHLRRGEYFRNGLQYKPNTH